MAEVCHLLNFRLDDLDEMDWPEIEEWHAEAARIVRALRGE